MWFFLVIICIREKVGSIVMLLPIITIGAVAYMAYLSWKVIKSKKDK